MTIREDDQAVLDIIAAGPQPVSQWTISRRANLAGPRLKCALSRLSKARKITFQIGGGSVRRNCQWSLTTGEKR